MQDRERNSLDKYLEEIGREELLTPSEERELAGRIRHGDSKAVDRLITANLRFVVSVARQYRNKGLDMQDLVSEGNVGLLKAAEKFDADRGVRFVSYAQPFVRKCMEQAIEEQAGLYRIPKNEVTREEKKRSMPLSADAPLGGRENVNLLSFIENPDAPLADTMLADAGMTDEIKKLLCVLDEREKEVITLFFGIGYAKCTFAEIAEKMELKRERVRQIRNKAIRKMARNTDNEALKAYFGR